ncbi:MAG: lipid A biosynthesis acyltransferase [Acetomicrobium flavidum]|uniref:Lauroyl/myristoyl acyltransferase n=1 Tax=Acetomicrobium mobile (strain ATCC BAA-54 / DSM 13181 / JCM 12221 / NGA) TaxID=891968 RepID=I4BYH0_ACEMN|nr:lipid A biosynthesis acyltransferase [Acetomicrobium mobile]AFM22327.1 Lauroyl/myristoyl acyltransferase [Acetomicrobium mobile DSM 13181]NLG94303.1 lipid A biosynthesis acyltransferase [Acetomicrobium flavidum]
MSVVATAIKGVHFLVKPGISANILAYLLYRLACTFGIRRNVALTNLGIAYPESDPSWRREVVKKLYCNLSLSVMEFLILTKNPKAVSKWVTKVEGEEHLENLSKSGRGAVLLTAHMGNWELLAAWLACKGYPLVAGVRDPNDVHVSKLLAYYRKALGVETIPKKSLLLKGAKLLKQGKFIGILADQDGGTDGIRVSFMGKVASTVGGPAALSLLTKAPVVPIVSYRIAPYEHEILVLPPIEPLYELPREEAIREMTIKFNDILEGFIRRSPEQWLWLHRRWRD